MRTPRTRGFFRVSSLALLFAAGLAAPADAASIEIADTALARIERAFERGELDAPTRALYGVYLLRAPERLPEAFRPAEGDPKPRCGTLLMLRAVREREAMSETQAAEFAALGGRPFTPVGSEFAVNYPVRVHYASAGDAGIAANVAAYADVSWAAQVDQMGYRAPLLDDGTEGATDLDIYLEPGLGYAYTAPEFSNGGTSNDDYSTFIVIDPAVPNIETYVAHELNHSVQFAYTGSEGDLLYEATATWMEDRVYDSVNDYIYFVSDFQQHPERTLSYATYSDTFMYGASVWLHYLSERFDGGGTLAVRRIWETAQGAPDYYDAIESQVLSGSIATIKDMYAEYAGYRYLAGNNNDGWFDEAPLWDEATRVATHAHTDSVNGGTSASNPMKLGANYIEVSTTGAAADATLAFALHGSTGTEWAVTSVAIPPSGTADVVVHRDAEDDGEVEVEITGLDQYEKVVFAVVNLGVDGQNPDNSSGGGHSADVTPSSYTYDLNGEGEAVACGCNSTRMRPTASAVFAGFFAAGMMLLVRRRT